MRRLIAQAALVAMAGLTIVGASPTSAGPVPAAGFSGGSVTVDEADGRYTLQGRFAAGGRVVSTSASGQADLASAATARHFQIHLTGPGLDAMCTSVYQDLGTSLSGGAPHLQHGESWYCTAQINAGPATRLQLALSTTDAQPSAPVPSIRSGVFTGVDAASAPSVAKASLGNFSAFNRCDHYGCGFSAELQGRIRVGGRSFVGLASAVGELSDGPTPSTLSLTGSSPTASLAAVCQWPLEQPTVASYGLMPTTVLSCVGRVGDGPTATFRLIALAPFMSDLDDGHANSAYASGVFTGLDA